MKALKYILVASCVLFFIWWKIEQDRVDAESKQRELEAYLKAGFNPEYHWYGTHWVKPGREAQ